MESMEEKMCGSLLGLATGDVIGCPVEGLHPEKLKARYGRVEGLVSSAPAASYYWRLPGLHSDDTQQALTISDVLIESGGFDEGLLVRKWVEMAQVEISGAKFGCHRGTGGGFRAWIRVYAGGEDPASTGLKPSMCDGAAMRSAPIGLFFRERRKERIDAAVRSALVTHTHPHAVASAAAMAAAAAAAMDGGDVLRRVAEETAEAERLVKEGFMGRIPTGVAGAVGEFSAAMGRLEDWRELPLEHALEAIARNAEPLVPGPGVPFATQSFSITAVPTALLIASRHLEDYRAAVLEAVNLGGDADSIGAMAGAVVGAWCGISGIPEDWQSRVLARGQVLLRAQALLTGKKNPGWIELKDCETEWTRAESGARSRSRPASKE